MYRFKKFIKTSVLGGITVILPIAIFYFLFKWFFNLITNLIQPITNLIVAKSQLQELLADLIVIIIIFLVCFVIGVFVKTKVGKFTHEHLENRILSVAPGYTIIKETIMQFVGKTKTPFSSVALVNVFENNTLMTAFITDEHPDGSYTVFVPTGPNPTSGAIYHLQGKYVQKVDVSIEVAMRSIISCGAGSEQLIGSFIKKSTRNNHDK